MFVRITKQEQLVLGLSKKILVLCFFLNIALIKITKVPIRIEMRNTCRLDIMI